MFDVRSEEHFNVQAHLSIEGQHNDFKLVDGDGNVVMQRTMTLRPMKNYTLTVMFCPQKTGAFYAKLIFVIGELRLILPMYGYGGQVRMIAKGIPKDGGGRMWLMLYQHPHKTEWESSFYLKNLGNIRGFIPQRIHKKQLASGDSEHLPSLDLAQLCEPFSGEGAPNPPNVKQLKDPKESALDLYSSGVSNQEIILMLENMVDGQGPDASRAFQSMYQNQVDLSCTKLDETVCSWEIVPAELKLSPPTVNMASVQIWSTCNTRLSYEASVASEPPGYTLCVSPNAGFIPAMGAINITVTCSSTGAHPPLTHVWTGCIQICTENDMKELKVRVEFVGSNLIMRSASKMRAESTRAIYDSVSKAWKK
ncbi:hypothetical protein L9F63_027134 [Diploptera punctata]|uniref:Uncharacterized protein n=1 Tax=Diploptera punctata TaxID=6984 RepID=A0AAD8ABW9_DIPPU|nr:hypothetical protein L9F63_027134 [Diploptera punctata]